ncbi:MAG: ribosome silencing factor [Pseudomonadota bacterium]
MQVTQLQQIVVDALEALKAKDIIILDVSQLTTIADKMVFCSGTSNRHVKSLAKNVIDELRQHQIKPFGLEGETDGEWVLVDCSDIIVHVMLPKIREFYQLEKLWDTSPHPTSKAKD